MNKDQASDLRRMAAGSVNPHGRRPGLGGGPCKTIAVTSGKGGVGKSNVILNTACALARMGKSVLVLDADFGLANIDILTGIAIKYNLSHVVKGERSIDEIVVDGPGGIKIVPASSGIVEMADMSIVDRERLISEISSYDWQGDFFLIDTGAGISANVVDILMAVPEVVVVTLPEPTAITDAYAIIKVLSQRGATARISLLVNQASSQMDGADTFDRLRKVVERFLPVKMEYLGCVLSDSRLLEAVMRQVPVVEAFPRAAASRSFIDLARKISGTPPDKTSVDGFRQFWQKMLGGDGSAGGRQ